MDCKQIQVYQWIEQNFFNVKTELFPLFPFGVKVIDAKGDHLVVYWNLLTDQVTYSYPSE